MPVIGEVYGYRARAVDELVPAKMVKEGTRKPARVLIRFEDPAMEGREEWVPPARLKVLWSEVEEFRAEEARWDAVAALSPGRGTPEVYAAEQACSLLVDEGIAGLGDKDAHLVVHDVAALGGLAGVEEAFVSSHPAGFNVADDGPLVVPWPVAIEIVRKVIRRKPEPVLAAVSKEEAEARYEAIHGHRFSGAGRDQHEYYIAPEMAREFDLEPEAAPKRTLLREWAGDATDRWDELVELRKEIKRVGDIAEEAIAVLRRRGDGHDADLLAKKLGMTVEMLRRDSELSWIDPRPWSGGPEARKPGGMYLSRSQEPISGGSE